ncbi:MAG: divalent-cation tolerance protein CutA [Acidimicrobiales bacterium]
MTGIVNVTITAPDVETLTGLTRELVETGLAASGNITEHVRSVYRWEGEVHEANEAVVSLRTQARHVAAIVELTKQRHPYVTPHVVAVPIVGGNPDYENWVIDSTRGHDQ